MTREEAIASYKKLYDYMVGDDDAIELDYGEFMELNHYIRSALRPVSREPLEKFKEYFDDLYGKGLEVYGWHMNGEAKSFDDFYEDACEYAGL